MPEEKEESLEERLKAGEEFPQEVMDAAEAYFQLDKNPDKALKKLVELKAIDELRRNSHLKAMARIKTLKDPAYKAKEAVNVYENMKKAIAYFIGSRISEHDNLPPLDEIKISTSIGERFLANYDHYSRLARQKQIPKEKIIYNSVREIISKQLNISEDKIDHHTNFAEDLGADSLDCVELIMEIEDQYAISITDDDAENMLTVKDVVDYLMKQDIELK